MDISNIQASAAYTIHKAALQSPEDTLLKNQNTEAVQTDLNQKNTQAAQQAFKVNITQEAQDRLAAEKIQLSAALDKGPDQSSASDPQPVKAQQASQIVNIVA